MMEDMTVGELAIDAVEQLVKQLEATCSVADAARLDTLNDELTSKLLDRTSDIEACAKEG